MSEKKSVLSFLEVLLAFNKSDDASTGAAMIATAQKEWKKEVDKAERSISAIKRIYDDEVGDLQDTLVEKKEAVLESFLTIDLEKRNKEQRISYLSIWEQHIANAKGAQKSIEGLLKAKAEKMEADIKKQEDLIALYNENLAILAASYPAAE